MITSSRCFCLLIFSAADPVDEDVIKTFQFVFSATDPVDDDFIKTFLFVCF